MLKCIVLKVPRKQTIGERLLGPDRPFLQTCTGLRYPEYRQLQCPTRRFLRVSTAQTAKSSLTGIPVHLPALMSQKYVSIRLGLNMPMALSNETNLEGPPTSTSKRNKVDQPPLWKRGLDGGGCSWGLKCVALNPLPASARSRSGHMVHSEILQSTAWPQVVWQCLVSSSEPLQGCPHSLFIWAITRCLPTISHHIGDEPKRGQASNNNNNKKMLTCTHQAPTSTATAPGLSQSPTQLGSVHSLHW